MGGKREGGRQRGGSGGRERKEGDSDCMYKHTRNDGLECGSQIVIDLTASTNTYYVGSVNPYAP